MADQQDGNGSNIVAIFAIVVIAGMAIAAAAYLLPRMMPKAAPADGMKIEVKLPTPEPTEAAPQP